MNTSFVCGGILGQTKLLVCVVENSEGIFVKVFSTHVL